MCFTAKNSVKERIAEKDIHVQKVLCRDSSGKLHSPFYSKFIWKIGVEKRAKIEPIFYDKYGLISIEEGLHSAKGVKLYSTKCGAWYCTNKSELVWICDYNENMVVYDCIIPKGSVYYKNSGNEYVSNCLKLVKEIKCEVKND